MRDNDPSDYDGIEEAVAKRLRPVCKEMSKEEFDDLVRTAALIQWKYEQRRDREARILFETIARQSQFADSP